MRMNFCTPVPARRISSKGKMELRTLTREASLVSVEAVYQNKSIDCGLFPVSPGDKIIKLYPNINTLSGRFLIKVSFLNENREVIETTSFPYEVVDSEVMSTRLLDGSWTSIYFWSDEEAKHFGSGLKQMTDNDWKQHIYDMHEIGITSVVIQNVFDSASYVCQHQMTLESYNGSSLYPSELYSRRAQMAAFDPLEAILAAADECGMAVFPGVGLFAWFDFSRESLKWHIEVSKELYRKYGHHPSFYGWYISEEIFGSLYFEYDPVPDQNYKDIEAFFEEYSAFIHELTPTKPIALAPNNINMHLYKEQWATILKNIDILIPFGFARSHNNIQDILEMCSLSGTHLWVDMELFEFPIVDGLVPKSFDEIISEMKNYDALEQIFGFQFTGLMNAPGKSFNMGGAATETLYAEYKKYYKSRTGNV